MKKYPLLVILLLSSFILTDSIFAQIPAFPGAEGFGASALGGRGGTVIKVTNLNNSGSGSLREAVSASGPRIVVFETGGIINLTSDLTITNPYLTIAGQTAPGDGICVSGRQISIQADHVVMRGMRIRLGDGTSGSDALQINGYQSTIENVIIDHCSISWATDENTSTFENLEDITFSWNIISEGINANYHSMGMLIGPYGAKRISMHHNLFAHNRERQPYVKHETETEIVNNVVYNWQNKATDINGTAKTNVVGNYYKPGLNWNGSRKGIYFPHSDAVAYVLSNIGPGRPTNTGNEWDACDGSESNRSLVPVVSSNSITIDSPTDAYALVLDHAGATIPQRDPVDLRVVQDVIDGTGTVINSQNDVGGFPVYNQGTPPLDTDGDGMPNDWEISHGLDPNDPADANEDRDGDGYTNIEEYINGFFPVLVGDTTPPDSPVDLRVIENGGDFPSGQ